MNTRPSSAYNPNKNPLAPDKSRAITTVTEQFEEAVVVDVIVNNEHREYAADGYNVGAIKFRLINSNYYMADEYLSWAFPMDSNFSEYPLVNELVYIVTALNRFYYFKKINVTNRPTAQPIFGLNEESQPVETGQSNNNKIQRASSSPIKEQSTTPALGQYFKDKEDVAKLKRIEGDVMIEGRSGQSVRMGTSWLDGVSGSLTKKPFKSSTIDQSPNILIRVGPDPKAKRTINGPFGLVIEDINNDASSIWMVSDQIVPLQTSTQDSKIQGISVPNYPKKLIGNQIVINTGQFSVNTKTDKIIGTSAKGIHWTTLQDYTVDSDRDSISWTNRDKIDRVVGTWKQTIGNKLDVSVQKDIIVTSAANFTVSGKTKVNFLGAKIYVGGQSEPLVLGKTLHDFLNQLIDVLTQEPIVLMTGGPGSPSPQNPKRIAKLKQLKSQFLAGGLTSKILSQDNFTTRTNGEPLKERPISSYQEG